MGVRVGAVLPVQALAQRRVAGHEPLPDLPVVGPGAVEVGVHREAALLQEPDAAPVVELLGERQHAVHVKENRLDHVLLPFPFLGPPINAHSVF